jgi:hypothetical protein
MIMMSFWVLAPCRPHGYKTQKDIIILTAVKTSNLTTSLDGYILSLLDRVS